MVRKDDGRERSREGNRLLHHPVIISLSLSLTDMTGLRQFPKSNKYRGVMEDVRDG